MRLNETKITNRYIILRKTAFTLIETLIAMVVLSIMLLFLYFIFKTTLRNRNLAVKSSKPYIEANLIFTEFHKKITEFNYLYPVFIGTYGIKNGEKLSSVYFSGLSETPVPFSKAESKENINYFYLKRQKNRSKNGNSHSSHSSYSNYNSNSNKNTANKADGKLYELIYEHSFYKNKKGNLKISFDRVVIAINLTFFSISYYYGGLWLSKFNYIRYNSAPSAVKLKFGILSNGEIKKFRYQFNM